LHERLVFRYAPDHARHARRGERGHVHPDTVCAALAKNEGPGGRRGAEGDHGRGGDLQARRGNHLAQRETPLRGLEPGAQFGGFEFERGEAFAEFTVLFAQGAGVAKTGKEAGGETFQRGKGAEPRTGGGERNLFHRALPLRPSAGEKRKRAGGEQRHRSRGESRGKPPAPARRGAHEGAP